MMQMNDPGDHWGEDTGDPLFAFGAYLVDLEEEEARWKEREQWDEDAEDDDDPFDDPALEADKVADEQDRDEPALWGLDDDEDNDVDPPDPDPYDWYP